MGNQVVHHHYYPARSPGVAALLELLPGLFLQTFGIGHIYAGRVITGILVMFAYWILLAINVFLTFLIIGFITWPLTWLAFAIGSPILAANACRRP